MKRLLVFFLAFGLAGCFSARPDDRLIKNRENIYLKAENKEPLKVPPWLDGDAIGNLLAIPFPEDGVLNPRQRTALAAPEALLAPDILDQIRIQSLEGNNWLVSPENPFTVWPKMTLFVSDNKLGTRRNEPTLGILETEWFDIGVEPEDGVRKGLAREGEEKNMAYRVEFKVEQAIRQGFTEVHARVFELELEGFDVSIDQSLVGERVAEKDVELLKIIASKLLSKDKRISVSLMADTINAESKATLLRDEQGQPVLKLNLSNARFFATVKRSLENANIVIESNEEDDSVIRIIFDRGLVADQNRRRSRNAREPLDLHLRWADRQGEVTVIGAEQQPLDPEYAEQILNLLREYAL